MRKSRLLVSLILILLIVVLGAGWMLRYDGPVCEIGPSKAKIRWVSKEMANSKPWINLPLPGGGRWHFPERGLPDHGLRDPYLDNALVCGYLVIDGDSVVNPEAPDMYGTVAIHDGSGQVVVPIRHPSTEASRSQLIIVDGEQVDIKRPYDPRSIPAKWDELEFSAGPYKFVTRVYRIGSRTIDLQVRCLKKDYVVATFKSVVGKGTLSDGGTVDRFSAIAQYREDGSALLDGRFVTQDNGREIKYPAKVVLQPRT